MNIELGDRIIINIEHATIFNLNDIGILMDEKFSNASIRILKKIRSNRGELLYHSIGSTLELFKIVNDDEYVNKVYIFKNIYNEDKFATINIDKFESALNEGDLNIDIKHRRVKNINRILDSK